MLQFLVKAVDSDDSLSEYLRLTTSLKPLLRSLQLRLAYGICTYSLVSGGRTTQELSSLSNGSKRHDEPPHDSLSCDSYCSKI